MHFLRVHFELAMNPIVSTKLSQLVMQWACWTAVTNVSCGCRSQHSAMNYTGAMPLPELLS